MHVRGVNFVHSAAHRWARMILQVLATVFRRGNRRTGLSWRMDETYIKVVGKWRYLCRAVDRLGDTVDFLLTGRRALAAARRFPVCVINLQDICPQGPPSKRAAPIRPLLKVRSSTPDSISDVSKQISRQHRRTGPPGHQTNDTTDAWSQDGMVSSPKQRCR